MVVDGRDVMTVSQAAVLLDVTEQHVRWLGRWARIRVRRVAGVTFVETESVRAYLRERALRGGPRRAFRRKRPDRLP